MPLVKINLTFPNHAASGNGAATHLLHVAHAHRAVPAPHRSPTPFILKSDPPPPLARNQPHLRSLSFLLWSF